MYTVFTVCKVNRTMKRNKYVLLFDDDEREKEVEDEEGLQNLDFLYALYVD